MKSIRMKTSDYRLFLRSAMYLKSSGNIYFKMIVNRDGIYKGEAKK